MLNNIHGLVQERRNSIAKPLELRISCTKPSISFPCFLGASDHLNLAYKKAVWAENRKPGVLFEYAVDGDDDTVMWTQTRQLPYVMIDLGIHVTTQALRVLIWPTRKLTWAERISGLLKIGWFTWITWWRHQMETFSALLAICAGNSPVSGEFPAQRPVTRSFDIWNRAHYDVIIMSKNLCH